MSDSTNQDMQEKWHPDILKVDLPRLKGEFKDEKSFLEMIVCLEKAINEVKVSPLDEGTVLKRPPLETFRKKKFHSKVSPPQREKADMRLIFRYSEDLNTLYLFGVGLRKSGLEEDVYQLLNPRDETVF